MNKVDIIVFGLVRFSSSSLSVHHSFCQRWNVLHRWSSSVSIRSDVVNETELSQWIACTSSHEHVLNVSKYISNRAIILARFRWLFVIVADRDILVIRDRSVDFRISLPMFHMCQSFHDEKYSRRSSRVAYSDNLTGNNNKTRKKRNWRRRRTGKHTDSMCCDAVLRRSSLDRCCHCHSLATVMIINLFLRQLHHHRTSIKSKADIHHH
jgi:hypothetical protein